VGAATARIGEEDFLSPPEFRGLRLARTPVGQVGGARVELVASGGRTRLGECYQQIPLRVLPPFHFPGEPAALLYLVVPTVGLLDGDAHLIEVVARAGTRAVVTGQSANRLHPALGSYATQQWRVRVEAGAELVVLPGPALPFRGCRYFQHVAVDLEPGARFIWGDVWLPGRYARAEAEVHAFDRLVQHLEVRRAGELVFRERFDWRGPWTPEVARWHLGDGLASGGLFVTGPVTVPAPAALALASGDTLVRKCGPPGEVVRELVAAALGQAGAWSGGPAWLVASGNFGPSHWFSPAHQPPAVVQSAGEVAGPG
jgi:urease accessory protein